MQCCRTRAWKYLRRRPGCQFPLMPSAEWTSKQRDITPSICV